MVPAVVVVVAAAAVPVEAFVVEGAGGLSLVPKKEMDRRVVLALEGRGRRVPDGRRGRRKRRVREESRSRVRICGAITIGVDRVEVENEKVEKRVVVVYEEETFRAAARVLYIFVFFCRTWVLDRWKNKGV